MALFLFLLLLVQSPADRDATSLTVADDQIWWIRVVQRIGAGGPWGGGPGFCDGSHAAAQFYTGHLFAETHICPGGPTCRARATTKILARHGGRVALE